jgi:pimeloyl-ACP methyl ester carboxylesterase
MESVILAHGLWVPGFVMRPLAARLERAGFRCHVFSYMGALQPMEAHVERLARLSQAIGPAHYVGHSLGGLLVMEALSRHAGIPAGRIVLLGTPARGSYAGRRIARLRPGRWIFGHSASRWREAPAACWTRPEPLGVVAGSLSLGLGRLFGRLPGVNDGAVCLEETAVEGMAGRVVLPIGHSGMLLSASVAAQVAAFLAEGRFLAHIH